MHFTVYKITCLINDKIYIGVHKSKNPNDRYLGSGTHIKNAIKKYGRENFVKEILYVYDNEDAAYQKEKELVTAEFIEMGNTYNIILGGWKGVSTAGTVPVRDLEGRTFRVSQNDPRFESGTIQHNCKGQCSAIVNGKTIRMTSEQRKILGYRGVSAGFALAFDIPNNRYIMAKTDDPRLISGEVLYSGKYQHIKNPSKAKEAAQKARLKKIGIKIKKTEKMLNADLLKRGSVIVRDKNGNTFRVISSDPRFVSGELKHIRRGQKLPPSFYEKVAKSIYTLITPDGLEVETKSMKGFAKQHEFVPMFKVGRKTISGWSLIGKRPV